MSEADWWLCPTCSSLNSLSARRCYSCRAKKDRQARRLSDIEAFRVVEHWDGRITYVPQERPEAVQAVEPIKPMPLRVPAPRPITAVAPPAPHGVRFVYREMPAPPPAHPRHRPPVAPVAGTRPASPPVPQAPPVPHVAYPMPSAPPSPASSVAAAPLRPLRRPASATSSADAGHVQTSQEAGSTAQIEIQHTGPWPHWDELLRGPSRSEDGADSSESSAERDDTTSDANRSASDTHARARSLFESSTSTLSLETALMSARIERSRLSAPSDPWPQEDLASGRGPTTE